MEWPKSPDDPMYMEWRAWQLVIQEMKKVLQAERAERDFVTPFDINDAQYGVMFDCIRAWGELLSELRSTQPDSIVNEARSQAILRVLHHS